jgi:hypothetical protein
MVRARAPRAAVRPEKIQVKQDLPSLGCETRLSNSFLGQTLFYVC